MEIEDRVDKSADDNYPVKLNFMGRTFQDF